MNIWQSVGIAAAFVAFFAVAFFVNAFIARGFLETCIPGGIAAYFTWKYFDKKDTAELQKLMNPPEEIWPVPLPVAWGSVKDVLATSGVDTRESGRQNWQLQREDQSRGIIQAQLNFSEGLAGPHGQKQMAPRSIGLTVVLAPDPAGSSGTRVKFTYQVFSQLSILSVKKIIDETNKQFPKTMIGNKEQQGL